MSRRATKQTVGGGDDEGGAAAAAEQEARAAVAGAYEAAALRGYAAPRALRVPTDGSLLALRTLYGRNGQPRGLAAATDTLWWPAPPSEGADDAVELAEAAPAAGAPRAAVDAYAALLAARQQLFGPVLGYPRCAFVVVGLEAALSAIPAGRKGRQPAVPGDVVRALLADARGAFGAPVAFEYTEFDKLFVLLYDDTGLDAESEGALAVHVYQAIDYRRTPRRGLAPRLVHARWGAGGDAAPSARPFADAFARQMVLGRRPPMPADSIEIVEYEAPSAGPKSGNNNEWAAAPKTTYGLLRLVAAAAAHACWFDAATAAALSAEGALPFDGDAAGVVGALLLGAEPRTRTLAARAAPPVLLDGAALDAIAATLSFGSGDAAVAASSGSNGKDALLDAGARAASDNAVEAVLREGGWQPTFAIGFRTLRDALAAHVDRLLPAAAATVQLSPEDADAQLALLEFAFGRVELAASAGGRGLLPDVASLHRSPSLIVAPPSSATTFTLLSTPGGRFAATAGGVGGGGAPPYGEDRALAGALAALAAVRGGGWRATTAGQVHALAQVLLAEVYARPGWALGELRDVPADVDAAGVLVRRVRQTLLAPTHAERAQTAAYWQAFFAAQPPAAYAPALPRLIAEHWVHGAGHYAAQLSTTTTTTTTTTPSPRGRGPEVGEDDRDEAIEELRLRLEGTEATLEGTRASLDAATASLGDWASVVRRPAYAAVRPRLLADLEAARNSRRAPRQRAAGAAAAFGAPLFRDMRVVAAHFSGAAIGRRTGAPPPAADKNKREARRPKRAGGAAAPKAPSAAAPAVAGDAY